MNEEKYVLTFKGILYSFLSETEAERIYEQVKKHAEETDHNAIVLDREGGSFISVEYRQDWDEEKN